jgi:CRISPR/Cas system CSM-associated protein Csm2 small subunit
MYWSECLENISNAGQAIKNKIKSKFVGFKNFFKPIILYHKFTENISI